MVRNYKRKKPPLNEDDVKNAVENVVTGTMTLRGAAATFGIKANTLFYRVKQYKDNITPKGEDFSSHTSTRQVFTTDEENQLKNYLLKSSKMHYGLTYIQTRSLAYDYAVALEKCPEKWLESKTAGVEWMKGFMQRNKDLSLRKPENTSLSRATSFNRTNVTNFQNNLEIALKKFPFTPDRILNLDETSVTTVVQAPNVIAQTGSKQVGQCVSAERGQLVTMCAIVTASGNTIPPVFIFPRARFHDAMLNGAPVGSIGFSNSPTSGWMTALLFMNVMEHIKTHTRCSVDDPILLLFDNHESHVSIDVIKFARENGIVIVTFPPHCTHRLQPLDVAVMGPFKQKLSRSQNDWLINNPGKTITIHDLAGIVNPAYLASFIPRNIMSGFEKTGICPFSKLVFSDSDFECAEVTNRAQPENPVVPNIPHSPTQNTSNGCSVNANINASPDCGVSENNTSNISTLITPETVRPYPKADARKTTRRGRKPGRTRILTDTPEKDQIEAEHKERMNRKSSAKSLKTSKNIKKLKRRKISSDDSVITDEDFSVHSEDDALTDEESCVEEVFSEVDCEKIIIGDFILAKFESSKKKELAFVGKVEEINECNFVCKFLKKKSYLNKFVFPDPVDVWPITKKDILAILPQPEDLGGSSRSSTTLSFNFNFSKFKLG